MYVVGHKTVRRNPHSRALGIFVEEAEINLAIFVVQEHIFTAIAAMSDVVGKTRNHHSRTSGHEPSERQRA
jgi:hypothetical protein